MIKTVHVKNLRCLGDAPLHLDPLTVLVGANGTGKSAFLRAIEMFYDTAAKYDEDDFYDKNNEISICVTYTDLTTKEKELFKSHLDGNDLTVEKVITWPPTKTAQRYYGKTLRKLEFDSFRQAKGAALREEYQKLLEACKELPPYSTKEIAEQSLRTWESTHPEQCKQVRDEGQFFGFKEVGETRLERFTRFILVPAVRDASDEAEGRRSAVSQIRDLVVQNKLAQTQEYIDLVGDTRARYNKILPALGDLSQKLTGTLCAFVPGSEVNLSWKELDALSLPTPEVNTRLKEDGYYAPVGKTGHGLQRAYILSMLQHLTVEQAASAPSQTQEKGADSLPMPNLIIAIEEPELYQHPDRQRHISRTLFRLAAGGVPGVADRIQIIYSTHSPLFVDIDRFEQIRIFRKVAADSEKPKQTVISQGTFSQIGIDLGQMRQNAKGAFTPEQLRPHLQVLIGPFFNEGFFARLVVLVEGMTDRGIMMGVAAAMGHDFDGLGIATVTFNGKPSLDYALLIFKSLDIPAYAIWDGDLGTKDGRSIDVNHRMLRLYGQSEVDFPAMITNDFAVFEKNLPDTLEIEVGVNSFGKILSELMQELEIYDKTKAFENPSIMCDFYGRIKKNGNSSPTLEKVVAVLRNRLQ